MTGCAMTDVCGVLGIARRTAYYAARARPRGRYRRTTDATVVDQIRAVTNSRATYGYRRVWAMVNRRFPDAVQPPTHPPGDAAARADAGATGPPSSWTASP